METHPISRLFPVGCCLLASAVLGFFLYIFFGGFYFDEMHIISTDYQLRPGLTLTQVVRDVLFSCNICAFITGVIVGGVWIAAIYANVPHWSKERKKSATKLAIGCWFIINAGVSIAGLQYVAHIAHRLGY